MAVPDQDRTVPPVLPAEKIVDPARRPSVIASQVDITYRVFGTGSGQEPDPQDEAGAFRRFVSRSRAGVGVREIHAVRGVSFIAYRGESIGLIGRNGSGKSTLLRSIAGLVPPTGGQIWIDGRAALLGVGAVLLPKMTGRQNIHIGCLAQGMTPARVEEVIEEIVEFADLGRFIDLPMNTYSTGMSARLRFAIAAAKTHDVLLIDEALATGDAKFKNKSKRRIEELRNRILITLGLLLVYRIGSFIALPGVDSTLLGSGTGAGSGLVDLLSIFTGGAFTRASIFALGVMPYISASIIMQLAGIAVPDAEVVAPGDRLRAWGEEAVAAD